MLLVPERALSLQLGLDDIEWTSNNTGSNASSGTANTVYVWLGQLLSQKSCGRWWR